MTEPPAKELVVGDDLCGPRCTTRAPALLGEQCCDLVGVAEKCLVQGTDGLASGFEVLFEPVCLGRFSLCQQVRDGVDRCHVHGDGGGSSSGVDALDRCVCHVSL